MLETSDCWWNERLDDCCDEKKMILLVTQAAYMHVEEWSAAARMFVLRT